MALDVSLVLAATASLLREDAAYRNVTVEISGSAAPVFADAGLLKIVFINVFINAAQAMRGQGVITVSIMAADGMSHIVIADQGPGISPDVRDKLFTPFVTTKARGTGLGLSTVKRLVEAHHGEIRVACPSHGGTEITILLPLFRPE
jgi:signal transduction histidine kinase